MTYFYIIRHGESVGNAEHRMGGLTDFALTERGVRQARALARRILCSVSENELKSQRLPFFADIPFSTIYTSPLTRAKRTAEIFCQELEKAQKEPFRLIVDERIIEVKTGILDGILFTELGEYERLVGKVPYKPSFQFPGGESIEDLIKRTNEYAEDVIRKHVGENLVPNDSPLSAPVPRERVAIFSHQLPINYLLHHFLKLPVDGVNRFPVGNATISIVSFVRGFPQLLLLNCPAGECGDGANLKHQEAEREDLSSITED